MGQGQVLGSALVSVSLTFRSTSLSDIIEDGKICSVMINFGFVI